MANYPNATIPTNIDLVPSAKSEFGPFYVSLFDRTLKKNPNAVVTEYAWQATSCDPCPTAPLEESDMATLGMDVLPKSQRDEWNPSGSFVLTRLHARYDKSSLGEDLVFRAAKPIEGGREHDREGDGLRQTAVETGFNNFQGRYAIRYPWQGEVKCKDPVYGRWGGPWEGQAKQGPVAARDTAFAKRDPELLAKLAEASVPEFEVKGLKPRSGVPLRGGSQQDDRIRQFEAPPGEGPSTPPKTKRWWEFWK